MNTFAVLETNMGRNYGTILVLLIHVFAVQSQYVTVKGCVRENELTIRCEDYIPSNVPAGVTKVILEHFSNDTIITSSLFVESGWNNVTNFVVNNPLSQQTNYSRNRITFGYRCLNQLVELESLSINVVLGGFVNGSFRGLNQVKFLDISGISNMDETILRLVLAPDSLLDIKTLIMRNVDSAHSKLTLNDYFWQMVYNRSISYIDISSPSITANMSSFCRYCDKLETLIVEGNKVIDSHTCKRRPCAKLKVVEISKLSLSDETSCLNIPPFILHRYVVPISKFKPFANVEKLSMDDICLQSSYKVVITDRDGLRFDYSFAVKELSLRRNNLVYLDVWIICEKPMLQSLILSENNMEYMSPDLLSCVYTLEILDLSNNLLGLMSVRNETLFRRLLKPLYNLIKINLAQNKLSHLPIDFFQNNTRLEVIDLNNNALTQIEFVFQPPQSFIHITISGNNIETLDPTSLQHLNDMLRNNNGKVDFDVNPLSCRKCGDLKYVSWIVEHNTRMENSANLTCTNENKKENAIDGKILTQVQSICNRPRTIAMWCSVGVGVLVVVLSFIFVVRKTIDSRRRKQNTSFVIKQIKEAKEGFEYAMFVSFSSKNQCMVDEQIIQPLEQELRHQIDVDRDLICIGDKHFRLGRPIVLETLRCLQMSHVAMCVVTNDFCHSEYSMNEVRQACQLNKRIILMIEEDTNTDLMSDDLRKLFEMNTRIVWTYRNEQLVLKTTWNHICTCILDI